MKQSKRWKRFVAERDAEAAVEYVVVLSLVMLIALIAVATVGQTARQAFADIDGLLINGAAFSAAAGGNGETADTGDNAGGSGRGNGQGRGNGVGGGRGSGRGRG
ncbi:MAG: hypothetical protein V3T70_11475 [Phycisphaerae bacterium]